MTVLSNGSLATISIRLGDAPIPPPHVFMPMSAATAVKPRMDILLIPRLHLLKLELWYPSRYLAKINMELPRVSDTLSMGLFFFQARLFGLSVFFSSLDYFLHNKSFLGIIFVCWKGSSRRLVFSSYLFPPPFSD